MTEEEISKAWFNGDVHSLRHEIERLRTALQEIATLPSVNSDFEIERRGQEFRLNEQARNIARRALEPEP